VILDSDMRLRSTTAKMWSRFVNILPRAGGYWEVLRLLTLISLLVLAALAAKIVNMIEDRGRQ